MNNLDSQYLNLIKDIISNGNKKKTRSGNVFSVFGRQFRHKMSDGFPLLTTKKLYYRGMIHELLWFIKGDTNIKYLIDNNVHVWDDDAYRFYIELINENNRHSEMIDKFKDKVGFEIGIRDLKTKEDFLKSISLKENIILCKDDNGQGIKFIQYYFGDLGPVYGYQWRNWGNIDQLKTVIETLRNNPDDRRMIVSAWNISMLDEMALPPCHYLYQFYTRELSIDERKELLLLKGIQFDNDNLENVLNENNIPKRELSLMWNQRSVDVCLGLCWNIFEYSLLLSLVAQCVNMTCGEVIGNFGDTHIYENHIDGAYEQLERNPNEYELPLLKLNPNIKEIDDFTFEDITILNYQSYPKIHFPLSVGL